jgi:ribosomal protein S27AE
MSDSKAELKARLLAKAEAAIDELLTHRKVPSEAKLADIEQSVLRAGQQIEQALTTELVDESVRAVVADRPTCPTCGRRLKVKGKRRRTIVLETGEVTVARSYYHCPACQTGVFPPG